jgi:hypothetical protein
LKEKDKSTAEFVAHNVTDNSILWSRIMNRDTPAYTINFGGPELIFSWLLKSAGGRLSSRPSLPSPCRLRPSRTKTTPALSKSSTTSPAGFSARP